MWDLTRIRCRLKLSMRQQQLFTVKMLSLKISDLRPKSEISRLQKEVGKRNEDFNDAGIWLHKKKTGDQIYVRILSYPVEWEKTPFYFRICRADFNGGSKLIGIGIPSFILLLTKQQIREAAVHCRN